MCRQLLKIQFYPRQAVYLLQSESRLFLLQLLRFSLWCLTRSYSSFFRFALPLSIMYCNLHLAMRLHFSSPFIFRGALLFFSLSSCRRFSPGRVFCFRLFCCSPSPRACSVSSLPLFFSVTFSVAPASAARRYRSYSS